MEIAKDNIEAGKTSLTIWLLQVGNTDAVIVGMKIGCWIQGLILQLTIKTQYWKELVYIL